MYTMTSHHLLLKVETLSVEKLPVNWRTYRISFGRQPKWKNSRLLQSRLSQSLPVWSSQLNRHRRPLSRWIYLNWDNLPKIKNNKKQLDSKSKSLMRTASRMGNSQTSPTLSSRQPKAASREGIFLRVKKRWSLLRQRSVPRSSYWHKKALECRIVVQCLQNSCLTPKRMPIDAETDTWFQVELKKQATIEKVAQSKICRDWQRMQVDHSANLTSWTSTRLKKALRVLHLPNRVRRLTLLCHKVRTDEDVTILSCHRASAEGTAWDSKEDQSQKTLFSSKLS